MREIVPYTLLEIEHQPFGAEIRSRQFAGAGLNQATLDYYGESHLAEGTGRDFFDLIAAGPESITAVAGHVSGGSEDATGLLASGLRDLLETRLPAEQDIRRVIRNLNNTICRRSDSMCATLFCAAIDANRRELRCINAGHEPALVLRNGGERVCRLERTGTVLGLTPHAGYGVRTMPINPGDVLVILTDGIVETTDRAGRMFGMDGALQVLRRDPEAKASRLVAHLMDAVRRFSDTAKPAADRTAVAVRFRDALASSPPEDCAGESYSSAA